MMWNLHKGGSGGPWLGEEAYMKRKGGGDSGGRVRREELKLVNHLSCMPI